jgi:hypothetical protein
VSNDTPIDPHSGEERAEPAVGEEQKAAEERLSELKHETQRMLKAERGLHRDPPGWRLDHPLERFTEEQAHQLWLRWLDQQAWRHAENPDRYGEVRSHNGQEYEHMLAYVAEKEARLREIRAEVAELQELYPSPVVAAEAAEIAKSCQHLEEDYSETGEKYPRVFRPYKPRGLT